MTMQSFELSSEDRYAIGVVLSSLWRLDSASWVDIKPRGMLVRAVGMMATLLRIRLPCPLQAKIGEQALPVLHTKRQKRPDCPCRCHTYWTSRLSAEWTNRKHAIQAGESKPPADQPKQVAKRGYFSIADWRFGMLAHAYYLFGAIWLRYRFPEKVIWALGMLMRVPDRVSSWSPAMKGTKTIS